MDKLKQIIKPYYRALKETALYRSFNTVQNLFFRHNNLLVALIKAKAKGNKLIVGRGVVLRHCHFTMQGRGNMVEIGDGCILSRMGVFMNSDGNTLILGKKTKVNGSKENGTSFNPCGGAGIIVGEQCLFSNGVKLHTTDYHKIVSEGKQINCPDNIVLGNHCWIGLQCLILKGTVLQDNVIVGAKSILNKNYEQSNVMLAGSPAKVIKTDVNWEA